MADFILHLPAHVVYAGMYLGIIFTGGATLLPAMLYALSGHLNLTIVFSVTLLATLTADASWYWVGRFAKKERIYQMKFVQKRMEEAQHFSAFFERHGVLLVFFTKFIWGARLASHILAGVHKISFWKFVLSTMLGTAAWFGMFYFLLRSVDFGITAVKATALRIQLLCFIFVCFAVLLNWFTGTYVRKKMMNR